MDLGLPAGVATVLLALLCLVLGILAGGLTSRRRTQRLLAGSRADVEELQLRLDEMEQHIAAVRTTAAGSAVPPLEYVITTAGDSTTNVATPVHGRAVLSVTLGEPLLRVVAFGYGVRRALSAESRNRIAFEMRREVKRARKERRRSLRRAEA